MTRGQAGQTSGVMGGLALVLGALLASAELAGGAKQQPDVNLSCYRCFKVTSEELCRPTQCSTTDRVCVSHEVLVFLKSGVQMMFSRRCAPRCPNTNMQHQWLLTSKVRSRITRQCCAHSLCNSAPATLESPQALRGGLLLPLGIGFLWVLL
ncbi:lymphocyte antigen 6L isoform X2 [Pteropus medius]|uniref:lymphocyte antigen 6L isoform X2 n=1 Tax=Pteropus vampyrus TaxID=132908 RepID=UPI00196B6849|nr:lymphocyte antigen 6L isoform X2 [Pteropus giganteus]